MKATKILAGLSATAIAGSMLAMVAGAVDFESEFQAAISFQNDTTKGTVDEWPAAQIQDFEVGKEFTLVYDAGDKTFVPSTNFFAIETGIKGEDGTEPGYEFDVKSIKGDGKELSFDASKTDTHYENGVLRYEFINAWGSGANAADTGSWEPMSKMEITLTINEAGSGSSSETADSYEVPAEYIGADGIAHLYEIGEDGETQLGCFDSLDKVLAYKYAVISIDLDDAAFDAGAAGETWVAGGFGTNDAAVGWNQKEWCCQPDVKDAVIEKVGAGKYQLVVNIGDVFTAESDYAQVWAKDWSGFDTGFAVTGVKLTNTLEDTPPAPGGDVVTENLFSGECRTGERLPGGFVYLSADDLGLQNYAWDGSMKLVITYRKDLVLDSDPSTPNTWNVTPQIAVGQIDQFEEKGDYLYNKWIGGDSDIDYDEDGNAYSVPVTLEIVLDDVSNLDDSGNPVAWSPIGEQGVTIGGYQLYITSIDLVDANAPVTPPADESKPDDSKDDDKPGDSKPSDSKDDTDSKDSSSATSSTTSSKASSTTSSKAAAGAATENPATGAAALGAVGLILAGAAMVVSKKKD